MLLQIVHAQRGLKPMKCWLIPFCKDGALIKQTPAIIGKENVGLVIVSQNKSISINKFTHEGFVSLHWTDYRAIGSSSSIGTEIT